MHNVVIFSLTLSLLMLLIVISSSYIIIETKIGMYKDFIMGMRRMFLFFVNPFTFCVTDHYLPQQYIMQTIKRLVY